MKDGLLISSGTAKTTKLKGLEKLLKPAGGVSMPSVSSTGGGTPGLSAFAIVDGGKLLQNDLAEQEVMSSALENRMPIVLENSNKEVTSALTGTGVDQEVVVLKPEGNRFMLVLIEQDKPAALSAMGANKDLATINKDLQTQGGNQGASAVGKGVISSTRSGVSIMEQVENALLPPVGDAPVTPMAVGGSEEPTPWHFSSKVSLPRAEKTMSSPNNTNYQTFSIRVDMQYDLYAVTNPSYKYLVVKVLGTGFSAGNMILDGDYARRFFQSMMQVRFGPTLAYDGAAIEEANPKNRNQDGSWTVSSGIEVGAALNISWPPGLEISASYNRSSAASVSLQDFDVINASDDATANFIYKLAMMEGHPVGDSNMEGDLDKSNPVKYRFNKVPILAKNQLTPNCEVVWRFPQDFNRKITMNVQLNQWIRDLYYGVDGNWHRDPYGPNSVDATFDIDFSKVKLPEKPEAGIPKFAARVLVEYKPEAGEVFTLRSLGDGTFEILESSTIPIPPRPEPILAYHTVQRGDMLSAISLRYYGSAARSEWYPIYEANKEIMKGGYNDLKPGMVLKIPKEAVG